MSKIKKDVFYSVIDQGMISVSNLGIGLFLINFSSKEQYGVYGIGFTIILLAVGIMNALITCQMTVNLPQKEAEDKSKYCYSMLLVQSLILVPSWLLFQLIVSGIYFFEIISEDLLIFMSVTGFSVLASVFHAFLRSYYYTVLRSVRVMQIDIINTVVIFSGLTLAFLLKQDFLHIWAIGAYGFGALIAGAVGLILANISQRVGINLIVDALKEAWVHGRWALGGVVVTWLQSQGYVALLTVLSTAESIAEANAAKLFLAPASLISTGLSSVFVPRLAMLRGESKHKELKQVAGKMLLLIVSIICLITFGAYAIKDQIIIMFFSKEYADIGSLVLLWGVVFVIQAIRSNASIVLIAYKKFRVITLCNTTTALLTILFGAFLIKAYGMSGSIISLASGELVLAIMLWFAFRSYSFEKI
jgi:O-antigen/teichoic acid export membrane protein